jgi:hypothetical protein
VGDTYLLTMAERPSIFTSSYAGGLAPTVRAYDAKVAAARLCVAPALAQKDEPIVSSACAAAAPAGAPAAVTSPVELLQPSVPRLRKTWNAPFDTTPACSKTLRQGSPPS